MTDEDRQRFDLSCKIEEHLMAAWLETSKTLPRTPLEQSVWFCVESAWKTAFKLKARDFCILAHGEQKRKYSGEPYWTHPAMVAAIVEIHGGTLEMVAAAYLHDVVEDTPTTLSEIAYHFGDGVAAIVDDLTDKSKPSDGNRAKRKEIDRQHLKTISASSKSVKCVDIMHNLRSISENDKGFARSYFIEKRACLEFLSDASIPGLYFALERMILDWFDANP